MQKEEIKLLLKQAQKYKIVANVDFRFDVRYYNLIPLIANEKLFLCINENDFIFDGFSIFRLKDIKKIEVKEDFCDKILRDEGLIDTIETPNIDISDWKSVFQNLKAMDKNIIVEKQTINGVGSEFVIGKIDKIYNLYICGILMPMEYGENHQ